MRTRFPFRYGIAALTALPHVFLTAHVDVDGVATIGHASDGLPPKWFTKDPATRFEDDLSRMFDVITQACDFAAQVGEQASVFDLWRAVHEAQTDWAHRAGVPPLLANHGTSLVERAVIEAFCKATGQPFHEALRNGTLGLRFGEVHSELRDGQVSDLLPDKPTRHLIVRHTVGLGDALTNEDIADADRANDGLPQSLAACIDTYGLTHFKIKVTGDADAAIDRLHRVAEVILRRTRQFAFTLDGNESFVEVEALRAMWERIGEERGLEPLMRRMLYLEQPLHRSVALDEATGAALRAWADRPMMIIDESDDAMGALPRALAMGYIGISHKNCKGVLRSVANAALIEYRRRTRGQTGVISGEDLANVGPVAMLQDAAVVAAMGLTHAERNGHHYFAGLSMFNPAVQRAMLTHHADLYHDRQPVGAAVYIRSGMMDLASVNAAPFGLGAPMDATIYTPLEEWSAAGLGA